MLTYSKIFLSKGYHFIQPCLRIDKACAIKTYIATFHLKWKIYFGVLGNNICVACSSSRSSTCIPVSNSMQFVGTEKEEEEKKNRRKYSIDDRLCVCVCVLLYCHFILPKTKKKLSLFLIVNFIVEPVVDSGVRKISFPCLW